MIKGILVVALAGNFVFAEAGVKKESVKKYEAVLETSLGTIVCELFGDKAPKAASNFMDLAQGKKEWTDSKTGKKVKTHFYDGLIFHRVIPNFMIQGGDPLGNGTGGPGYQFEDEINADLQFDRPGRLAMANAGPNTNGSQFFITVAKTPWLDPPKGRYTIFGQCAQGLDVADKIVNVPRGDSDRPLEAVVIKKVTIREVKPVAPKEKKKKKQKSK